MGDRMIALSLVFFAASAALVRSWITAARFLGMGEAIKDYGPQTHKKKRGTPNMGGVAAFALVPFIVFAARWFGIADTGQMSYIWTYPALSALVGLADDLLKRRSRSSEGLKSLQKLFLQIVVTVPWAYVVSHDGVYLLPWLKLSQAAGMPLLIFLGVGVQNAVNVTDGLDGLAGGAVAISLASVLIWADSAPVALSSALGLAIILAFLWYNSNPAEVFMGDVGSHLWAGLLISLCVASRSLLYLIPISFIFGVEIATVAVQIVAIRKFERKVFKMSPLHHHFELSGWSEPKIVTRFWLAHLVGMSATFLFIEALFGGGSSNAGG